MSDHDALVQELMAIPHALTTVATKDASNIHRLHNALARGIDELFLWGLGPDLKTGSIVPLYVTNTDHLPETERKCIRRIYATASATTAGRSFRHHVFLHRGIELSPPISFRELRDAEVLSGRDVQRAGHATKPWSEERVRRFWQLVLSKQSTLVTEVKRRFLDARDQDYVAISYAGTDWMLARRLKMWLEEGGHSVFFVTSTVAVEEHERDPLHHLLRQVFGRARVSVFVVPRHGSESEWTKLERESAIENDGHVILLERGGSGDAEQLLADLPSDAPASLHLPYPQHTAAIPHFERTLAAAVARLMKQGPTKR